MLPLFLKGDENENGKVTSSENVLDVTHFEEVSRRIKPTAILTFTQAHCFDPALEGLTC